MIEIDNTLNSFNYPLIRVMGVVHTTTNGKEYTKYAKP